MAYADALRAATATMETAATLIEGLVTDFARAAGTSLINTTTTSSSGVDYTSASVSITAAANDRVLIIARNGVSNSNSGNIVTFDVYEDATRLDPGGRFYCARASVDGFDSILEQTHYRTPSAGAHTYKIKWYTNANTAYSYGFELIALAFQQV